MKKILILILSLSIFYASCNTYLISNGGQQSENNYIGVYDENTQSSALVGGYLSASVDNGHCVQGNIVPGKSITILIPEDLSKFGLVKAGCAASVNADGSYNFDDENCAGNVLCDAIVKNDSNTNIAVKGKTLNKTLHVSPVCQQLGAYIINNFADQSSTNFSISEYASCADSKTSYCAVQFQPKNSDFKLRINTDYLVLSGHNMPSSCSIGTATASSTEDQKNAQGAKSAAQTGDQSACNLLIKNTQNPNPVGSFNIQGASINDWINNNLGLISQGSTNLTPPAGYLKCSYMSPQASQNLLSQAYQKLNDNKHQMINQRMMQFGFAPAPPDPMPANPTMIQRFFEIRWKALQANTQQWNDYQSKLKTVQQDVESQITKQAAQDVSNGIPCIGTVSTDLNGDPQIIYSCTTLDYNPDYTCNFIYNVTNSGCAQSGSCTMKLSSAYCDFPASIAVESPQQGDSDFYCGYCGPAEIYNVGQNKLGIGIESGAYGKPGALYPFATNSSKNPVCSNGFISEFGG